MTARKLLTQLWILGVNLKTDGVNIQVEAPSGVVTPEIRNALIKHKKELIRLLCPFKAPVVLGPNGEDPMNYKWDSVAGGWAYKKDWWRKPLN